MYHIQKKEIFRLEIFRFTFFFLYFFLTADSQKPLLSYASFDYFNCDKCKLGGLLSNRLQNYSQRFAKA